MTFQESLGLLSFLYKKWIATIIFNIIRYGNLAFAVAFLWPFYC